MPEYSYIVQIFSKGENIRELFIPSDQIKPILHIRNLLNLQRQIKIYTVTYSLYSEDEINDLMV